MSDATALIEPLLAARLATAERRPFVLGIAGSQGSGKSTLAAALADRLGAAGRRTAILSLDDLYLGRAARTELARTVHPLLATRGVPGTHDPALGIALIDALSRGEPVRLPRFDKARDEPRPDSEWAPTAGIDVLIFEGWCIGARPQPEADLRDPINALERDEDAEGSWRRWVNTQLAGPYRPLFDRIDLFVLLAAPSFGIVADWRIEQEETLRRHRLARSESVSGLMDDAAVRRFVLHYQRITEHLLRKGPGWADLTLRLDADRRVVG